MCKKAIGTYPSAIQFVPDQYKTQKMSDKVISKESFMLNYCLDRYNTQEMWNKIIILFCQH